LATVRTHFQYRLALPGPGPGRVCIAAGRYGIGTRVVGLISGAAAVILVFKKNFLVHLLYRAGEATVFRDGLPRGRRIFFSRELVCIVLIFEPLKSRTDQQLLIYSHRAAYSCAMEPAPKRMGRYKKHRALSALWTATSVVAWRILLYLRYHGADGYRARGRI